MHDEIEVQGRLRQVIVHRFGDGFAVDIDGRRWLVDAARIGADSLSLVVAKVPPNGDDGETVAEAAPASPRADRPSRDGAGSGGRSYEVTFVPRGEGRWGVNVGPTSLAVAFNSRRRRKADESGQVGNGPQRVTAPMPGKIVRILVAAGHVVQARQPLIVVEAMKMENELRAARDGTVAEIHVVEGASVEAGAPLIDIL